MTLKASLVAIAGLVLLWAAPPPSVEERLARHRNLGKAFYENPTTQTEAVTEFKAALALAPNSVREQLNYALALLRAGQTADAVTRLIAIQKRDPSLPHTWFNLGIYYKKSGETDKAVAQFEHLLTLAPNEPIAHYQLGTLYRLQERPADARAQFERAAQLDPQFAAPRFQLYNSYRQAGQTKEAAQALADFQRLKKQNEGAVIPEDVDWCTFAEVYDPPATAPRATLAAQEFEDKILDFPATGMALIDSTGAGKADVLAWSNTGIALYRHGAERAKDTGLENLTGIVSVAPGDFDNDGLMDLCILTESGPLLYRNTKGTLHAPMRHLPQAPLRARRLDRLRSRLRSRPGAVGRFLRSACATKEPPVLPTAPPIFHLSRASHRRA